MLEEHFLGPQQLLGGRSVEEIQDSTTCTLDKEQPGRLHIRPWLRILRAQLSKQWLLRVIGHGGLEHGMEAHVTS